MPAAGAGVGPSVKEDGAGAGSGARDGGACTEKGAKSRGKRGESDWANVAAAVVTVVGGVVAGGK